MKITERLQAKLNEAVVPTYVLPLLSAMCNCVRALEIIAARKSQNPLSTRKADRMAAFAIDELAKLEKIMEKK